MSMRLDLMEPCEFVRGLMEKGAPFTCLWKEVIAPCKVSVFDSSQHCSPYIHLPADQSSKQQTISKCKREMCAAQGERRS